MTSPHRIAIIISVRNDAEVLARSMPHQHHLPGMAAAEVTVAAAGDRAGTEHAVGGRALRLWPDGASRAGVQRVARLGLAFRDYFMQNVQFDDRRA